MTVYNGTTGIDIFNGGTSADEFRFEAGEFQPFDTVNGGTSAGMAQATG